MLGAAPKTVGAPANILLLFRSCGGVPIPTTISQAMRLLRLRSQQPAAPALFHQHGFEVGLRAAEGSAIYGGNLDLLAHVAQRDGAAPGDELQPAFHRLLLARLHDALMAVRR